MPSARVHPGIYEEAREQQQQQRDSRKQEVPQQQQKSSSDDPESLEGGADNWRKVFPEKDFGIRW